MGLGTQLHLFKGNIGNTRTTFEICSNIFLVSSLLLNLNRFRTLFRCVRWKLWTSKWRFEFAFKYFFTRNWNCNSSLLLLSLQLSLFWEFGFDNFLLFRWKAMEPNSSVQRTLQRKCFIWFFFVFSFTVFANVRHC